MKYKWNIAKIVIVLFATGRWDRNFKRYYHYNKNDESVLIVW